MAGEWTTVVLGEICEFRAGSVFKPAFQGQSSGSYPFVKVSDMNLSANAVCIQTANNWISEDDLSELRAKPFPPGTVVFAKIGEALRQNRLRQVIRETIVDNNMMGAVPHTARIDPCFFYYALSKFDFSDIAQGTALPYLTISALSGLKLDVPPLTVQRAIAHILGTLDDKIELNRKMNRTLEAMAQAVFKSWFVDFDPVHAKAEGGHPPGLKSDIAALFPDSYEDSELIEIPKEWKVCNLGEVTAYLSRGISPKYTDKGGVLVLNQKCIRGGYIDSSKARRHDSVQRNIGGRQLAVGDVLINSTGVGTLGRVAQLLLLEEETIVDSHVTVIRADQNQVSWNYLGIELCRREAEIEMLGEGSTGQTELSRARLTALPLIVPGKELLKKFDELTLPLRLRRATNERESRTLAALRDSLLPKLISGELLIPEAEKLVEGVA